MNKNIIEINNLSVSFDSYAGNVQAVRNVSFYVQKGETLAIVGESGSGKSVTVQSLMRLIASPPGKVEANSVLHNGKDIMSLSEKQMEKLRGNEISMIFQDPMTSLNPTMTIGKQISEVIRKHKRISRKEALHIAEELLKEVGIPNSRESLKRFPHMLSGGMRQRVVIAIAIACSPKLLIADEPTTALDVTTQAQIIELINKLKKQHETSVLIITHDLGVVARMADRIAVMYSGKIVETGTAEDIFYNPRHPYTIGLLSSIPAKNREQVGKLSTIQGTPPDLVNPPPGCSFAPRCKFAMNICWQEEPVNVEVDAEHHSQCWLLDEKAPEINWSSLKEM